MSKIIMPFEPELAQEILSGNKTYIFKRFAPSKEVSVLYVYATDPIKKVIGQVKVEEVISKTPYEIWFDMSKKAKLNPEEFLSYYGESKQAVVYKLAEPRLYKEAKNIADLGLEYAPVMLSYVD